MSTYDVSLLLFLGGLLAGLLGLSVGLFGTVLWASGLVFPKPFARRTPRKIARIFQLAGTACVFLLAPTGCLGSLLLPGPEHYLPAVAENGDRLVVAIQAFEVEHGHPPESLEELMPRELERLPETGYPARGGWEYIRCGATWSLCAPIYTIVPLIDFDEFCYMPEGVPAAGYRSWERHGNWLYLDD
jgi:hypothetical protein